MFNVVSEGHTMSRQNVRQFVDQSPRKSLKSTKKHKLADLRRGVSTATRSYPTHRSRHLYLANVPAPLVPNLSFKKIDVSS